MISTTGYFARNFISNLTRPLGSSRYEWGYAIRGLAQGRAASFAIALLALALAPGVEAASLAWSGVLIEVVEDSGTGTYTGGTPGVSIFSGSFDYGDACGGCLVEPFPPHEINYVFAGGTGSLTGLGVTTTGVESSVAINNDEVIDDASAALFDFFGIPVTPNVTTSDAWTVASETAGEVIEWEVAFVYITTDPFSDSSYMATPPPNPDLVIFQVDEDDEVTYFAFGEATVVPLPAAVWLFGSALLGLVGMTRGMTP